MSHRSRHQHHRGPLAENTMRRVLNEFFGDGTPDGHLKALADEGPEAERRFLEAWKTKPPWVQEVRKGTPQEDMHEHTDFWFVINLEDGKTLEIRIDVKASISALKAFQTKHKSLKYPVAFVVAHRGLSQEEVRRETLKRVRIFIRENHTNISTWFQSLKL